MTHYNNNIHRKTRRNPASVAHAAWDGRVLDREAEALNSERVDRGEEPLPPYEARRRAEERAIAAQEDHYGGILVEVLRELARKTAEARRAGAFDAPARAAEAALLPRYLGAALRDFYAATYIDVVLQTLLYRGGRAKIAARSRTIDEAQAYDEALASGYQAYFDALGAYESRPERFAALRAVGGAAGGERWREVAGAMRDWEAAVTAAQAEMANASPGDVRVPARRAVERLAQAKTAAGPVVQRVLDPEGKRQGQLRSHPLHAAMIALGWVDAARLVATPNVTKLRGAAARMRQLAQRGERPIAPLIESLEEAEREGELSEQGAKALAKARRLRAAAESRAAAKARAQAERDAALLAQTQESMRYLAAGEGSPKGVEVEWVHPDLKNPALERVEFIDLYMPTPAWGGYAPSGADGEMRYRAYTRKKGPRVRGGQVVSRRVYAAGRFSSEAWRRGRPEPPPLAGEFQGGVGDDAEKARMDALYRRAFALLDAYRRPGT